MGKSKEIPIEVRSQIIALYNHTSKSHRQIATVIRVSHSSVTKIIRLYKETGFLLKHVIYIYVIYHQSSILVSYIEKIMKLRKIVKWF